MAKAARKKISILFSGLCCFLLVFGGFLSFPKPSTASTYSDTVQAESTLLYYWQMNEGASASTLAATVGGTALNVTGATTGVAGQIGNAVSFDGVNDFLATASTLNLTAYSKIVVEALIKTNAYDGTPHYAWEFSTNLTLVTTGFQFAVDGGGGGGSTTTTNTRVVGNIGASNATHTRLTTGTWHHVVTVFDKTLSTNEVDLYVDGVLQTPLGRPTNTNNTNAFGNHNLYIMSRAGTSLFTAGTLQHLAIYSGLSASRILAHAQAAGVVPLTAGTLSLSSRTSTTATLSWTDATNGFAPITAQLQRSAFGANSWSNVSGATTSPGVDTGLTATTDYDYRVAYTDATPTTVYSSTVSVKTDSDPADTYRQDVEGEPTLLYYWPLDESSGTTALPLVGGTSLTLSGATPNVSGEVDGTAVSFDGVNDYAATSSAINLTAYNKIVVEGLMKIDSYDTTPRYAWELSTNMTAVTTGFDFSIDGGASGNSAAALSRLNGNVGFSTASYSRMTTGTWHHVVTVYDKSASTNEVDLYIDGVLQSATSRPLNANNTNAFGNLSLYIMSRAGTSLFVPGDLQHLAIYSDLSASQILTHAEDSGVIVMTPGTLTKDDQTSTTATLSWTAATNGTGVVTTQLQRSAEGADTWSDVSGATTSPATDTGLTSETGYDYRVAYTDDTSTAYSNTVTVTTLVQYPPFTANNDEVIVAPYDTAVSGAGNFGTGANASRETIEIGHPYRIRENGTLNRVRLYTATKTGLTGFYVKVWRKNGTNYDLVGTSNNLLSSMTAGALTTIDLSSPIANVHEGDYYGFRIEGDGTNHLQLVGHASTVVSSYSIFNTTASDLDMDWASQLSVATSVPIELYMQAPQMVFIGDSLIAGRTANYSFIENTELTCMVCTMERQLHNITGYTYQNMGISSQTSFDIKERFTNDVINLHPRIAVIEGGANDFVDYNSDTSEPNFLTHWTRMLDAAQASDSIQTVFVMLLFPCTSCTGHMDARDQWNIDLTALASTYSKAHIVDVHSYIGQDRTGAYAGNLWDIQPAYDADGAHLNTAGYGQVAQAIADAIDTTPPTITSVTSSTADGAYGAGQNINITVHFSEAVTSTGNVTVNLNTTPSRSCTFTVTSATSGSCTYTVQAGDSDTGLTASSISGTLEDSMTNAMVDLTPSTNLAASKTIVIDTTAPSGVSAPTFGTVGVTSIEVVKPGTVTETESGLSQWQARQNASTALGLVAVATASITDTSLSENTSYTYDAQFTDAAGNASAYGTTATTYTLADTPTNLVASLVSGTSVTLSVDSFPNATAGSSGYYFSRAGANSGWIQTNSWIDTAVVCGNSYTYSVKYRNGDGTETSTIQLVQATPDCGISASAIDGDTSEAGGTAAFTVVLLSQPSATVTVPLSSSDTGEGTLSTSLLTFTTANWNIPQTVTVTGVNDDVDDGDIDYTIVLAAATSADVGYSGLDPNDVSVTNTDDDTASITISPISGNTSEAGGAATFTVVLTSEPTADVTMPVSSSNTDEGTVSPASLTFTSGNWDTPQTVTATGVDDAVDDGDVVYAIVIDATSSADPLYNAINPPDVSVTNIDDDGVGILTSTISGHTTEAGGTSTFTVVLTSQPLADVTIPLSSSDTAEGTVSPSSLTFTNGNWNITQLVTLTGVNDDVDDGNIGYFAVLGSTVSSDTDYNGINPADIPVVNNDNDTVGVTVGTISGPTTEAGGTATFTVVLTSEPTADVTVPMTIGDPSEGAVSDPLVFTSANWDTPQTVTVTGVDDDVDDGDIAYQLVLGRLVSADPLYAALDPINVGVENTDDDTATVVVAELGDSTDVVEGGATDTYTLVLASEPTADVVVTIVTDGQVTTDVSFVTFTSETWDTPQTVTVTAVDDGITEGAQDSVISHTVSTADGAYGLVSVADVTVHVTDPPSSHSGGFNGPPTTVGGGGGGTTTEPPATEEPPPTDTTPPPTDTGTTPPPTTSTEETTGSAGLVAIEGRYLRTATSSTVYYVGGDGVRHPFLNAITFHTFQPDFSEVVVVSDAELAAMPLGLPVVPRYNATLVKILTSMKVYALQEGSNVSTAVLHWIPTEALASIFLGVRWSDYIIDISDQAYGQLTPGRDLTADDTLDVSHMQTRESLSQ